MARPRRGSSRSSGRSWLHELERTLGVGVVVQAIDEGPPVTISALVMFGVQRGEVHGVGPTEADAWKALASAIESWRADDDKHVTMWGGGF